MSNTTTHYQKTDLSEIPQIVNEVRNSFNKNKTRPMQWRIKELNQISKLLRENRNLLVTALETDLRMDKLLCESEVSGSETEIYEAIQNLSKWNAPVTASVPFTAFPSTAQLVKEPLGVVLIISSWNYPVSLLTRTLIGAIAAGNCVVIKPSEISESTSSLLAGLYPKYMDNDCIRVIMGGVEETQALLKLKFDKICFTGSTNVGRMVMKAAAEHLTPVLLELGGKSPVIVDKRIDLHKAVPRIVWGKFLNTGQTCIAPDYVLVHKDVLNPFLKEVKKVIERFWGKDPQLSSDFGRIINSRHFERLNELLRTSGGKVVYGGRVDGTDRYVSPTVIVSPSLQSRLMQEEIFGPLMPVIPVSSVDEAVSFVNQRPKPLALYVFTTNSHTADLVLQSTSSGGACVNETVLHNTCLELPFGGVGESGMGSYNGRHSYEAFVHVKGVLRRGLFTDPSVRYPPYDKRKMDNLRRLKKLEGVIKYGRLVVALAILVAVVALVYYWGWWERFCTTYDITAMIGTGGVV